MYLIDTVPCKQNLPHYKKFGSMQKIDYLRNHSLINKYSY